MRIFESTAVDVVVSDESGYSFLVELAKIRDGGWTGQLVLRSQIQMKDTDGTLDHLLEQAKQFVRIMEKG